jgi:hypothetical protein
MNGASNPTGTQEANGVNSGYTGGAKTSSNMEVEGCLNGSNGNYALTDKMGQTWQLSGDTGKLSQHVGQSVKVWGKQLSGNAVAPGNTDNASMAGQFPGKPQTGNIPASTTANNGGTGDSNAAAPKPNTSTNMLQVHKVKKASGSCNANNSGK